MELGRDSDTGGQVSATQYSTLVRSSRPAFVVLPLAPFPVNHHLFLSLPIMETRVEEFHTPKHLHSVSDILSQLLSGISHCLGHYFL